MANLRDGPWLPWEESEAGRGTQWKAFPGIFNWETNGSQASLTEDASFWVPSEGPLGARALEEGVVSLSFMAPALWNSLGLKFPVLLGLKCCNHCWV